MTIQCPTCKFTIAIASPRAGSFAPRCPSCKGKFSLKIPEGENPVPRVGLLPAATAASASTAVPSIAETVPPRSAASTIAPRVTPAAAPKPAETLAPMSATRVPAPAATLPPTAATVPPSSSPATASAVAIDADMPATLGGYQIQRKLGQGGMGAVYLARQISLDRPVAVKVLSPQLSADAGFVARFTREAYAAAQLVHHHVVQVYDIGEDAGRHFYSMEFVDGSTLGGLVERDGRLDPETAVAYTLQAARGLKFAHDHGLVHRDVKPDNLMVNAQGIVKVADLGLVKQRGVGDAPAAGDSKLTRAQSADVTGFNFSMGTPAYMAPEQARDAAGVDQRADIYSLGCTLYDLLTGRPPFSGKTALEVMTKHASEPVTPPDVLSKRVPKEVSALLMKMVAKRPEDRYADTGQCIAAMEDFLGVGSTGPFTPKEEHAAAMEASAKAYREAKLAKIGQAAVPAYFALCGLLAVIAALLGGTLASRVIWVGTFTGLAVLTAVAYVVLAGATRRDVTLGKLRPLVFDLRVGDWVRGVLVAGVLAMLLYVFGLLWPWVAVAVIAAGVAAAYHFGLQRARDRQRRPAVESTQDMLRTIRLRGLDEETLRAFVCRYSGQHWEEFYEDLFGYDAKLEARRRWGLSLRGRPRPKFGVWRDALVAWANARVAARKAAREQRLLASTEVAKLRAEGVDARAAKKKAEAHAAEIVRRAERTARQMTAAATEAARSAATAAPTPAAVATPAVQRTFADEPAIERDTESAFRRKHGSLFGFVFGPSVRFPIAMVLLAAFFLWFHQANPDFPNDFGREAKATIDAGYGSLKTDRFVKTTPTPSASPKKPARVSTDVQIPLVPIAVRHMFSGYGVGLAGLLLLASCVFRGALTGLLALAGAAAMVAGPSLVPGFGAYGAAAVATAAGLALFVAGFFARRAA